MDDFVHCDLNELSQSRKSMLHGWLPLLFQFRASFIFKYALYNPDPHQAIR